MTLFETLSDALKRGHALGDAIEISDDHNIPIKGGRYTPAAVMIAITDRPRPGVILTHRPDTMRAHAGQVAFPGGKIDPEDRDAVAAALREAEEEIDMPTNRVRIIGTSDCYHTASGYAITPVLGIVPPDLPYRCNPVEVDSLFEAPLDFVLDCSNHKHLSGMWQGHMRHYLEIYWQEHRIWGVTAGIIANLARRLQLDDEIRERKSRCHG